MRAISLLLVVAAIGAAIWYFYPGAPLERGMPQFVEDVSDAVSPRENVEIRVEEVARGLVVPWSIVFTSPERMLVSERPGRIRVIENGALRAEPLHTFSQVSSTAEEGLMSLALHPQYSSNKFVYAVYAYASGGELFDRIVRFRDDGDSISGLTTIMDGIPAARYHAGARLSFGPDGMLYISTGDATDRNLAQDLDSLAGKILRVTDAGEIPADNPFDDSAIWSYGHRNPQGLAWDEDILYSTEHGPSTFDGPPGGDEVNRIEKGANYGWPLVSHDKTRDGTVSPLVQFTPAEAPGSLMIYSGRTIPQFEGNLFFGALIGEGLMRVILSESGAVASYEKLAEVDFGRIREVIEGPDGAIYFSTSNRDGRGDPAEGDDRIFRIVPAE